MLMFQSVIKYINEPFKIDYHKLKEMINDEDADEIISTTTDDGDYLVTIYMKKYYDQLDYNILKLLINKNVVIPFDLVWNCIIYLKDIKIACLLYRQEYVNMIDDIYNQTLLHRYLDKQMYYKVSIIQLLVTEQNKRIMDHQNKTPLQIYLSPEYEKGAIYFNRKILDLLK